jgi:hypothetical protein
MDPVIIPHINARIDISDRGEGTYSGQGIAGDIPHGLGSWKAHAGLWFAGEWDHGVPVRGVFYDDGWVDFGEFSPDLTRKGWAAAFLPHDPSVSNPGLPSFFAAPFFNRPPSPPDVAMRQAMASLGVNDPSVFPSSSPRRAAKSAAAPQPPPNAAASKPPPAIQVPVNVEGQFDGTKCRYGNIHAGHIIGSKPIPDDVAQKVEQHVHNTLVLRIVATRSLAFRYGQLRLAATPRFSRKCPICPNFSRHTVSKSQELPLPLLAPLEEAQPHPLPTQRPPCHLQK